MKTPALHLHTLMEGQAYFRKASPCFQGKGFHRATGAVRGPACLEGFPSGEAESSGLPEVWAPSPVACCPGAAGRGWGLQPPPAVSKPGPAWSPTGPDTTARFVSLGGASQRLGPGGGVLRGMALTHHAHGDEDGDLVDSVHHRLCKEAERMSVRRCHRLSAAQTRGLDITYNLHTPGNLLSLSCRAAEVPQETC